eukprot:2689910-Rhodomonas_salina.1
MSVHVPTSRRFMPPKTAPRAMHMLNPTMAIRAGGGAKSGVTGSSTGHGRAVGPIYTVPCVLRRYRTVKYKCNTSRQYGG